MRILQIQNNSSPSFRASFELNTIGICNKAFSKIPENIRTPLIKQLNGLPVLNLRDAKGVKIDDGISIVFKNYTFDTSVLTQQDLADAQKVIAETSETRLAVQRWYPPESEATPKEISEAEDKYPFINEWATVDIFARRQNGDEALLQTSQMALKRLKVTGEILPEDEQRWGEGLAKTIISLFNNIDGRFPTTESLDTFITRQVEAIKTVNTFTNKAITSTQRGGAIKLGTTPPGLYTTQSDDIGTVTGKGINQKRWHQPPSQRR